MNKCKKLVQFSIDANGWLKKWIFSLTINRLICENGNGKYYNTNSYKISTLIKNFSQLNTPLESSHFPSSIVRDWFEVKTMTCRASPYSWKGKTFVFFEIWGAFFRMVECALVWYEKYQTIGFSILDINIIDKYKL